MQYKRKYLPDLQENVVYKKSTRLYVVKMETLNEIVFIATIYFLQATCKISGILFVVRIYCTVPMSYASQTPVCSR